MIVVSRPPANAFVASARCIYNAVGLAKGYNFILFVVFGGALLGECYYYLRGVEGAGITMHLAGILPAALLAVFQFVPAIRHKAIVVHRVGGYLVLLLSLVGVAGVFMIARHGLKGGPGVQSAAGMAAIVFVTCKAIAFYNIRMLQIEQHRAWMLQAWALASFIITMRIIAIIMAGIVGKSPRGYYTVRPCCFVDSIYRGNRTTVVELYPPCAAFYSSADLEQYIPVPEGIASAVNLSFCASAWLAFALHAITVKVYLRLTPAETERLRRVSYQRQREAGMKSPGNAGLTAQRLGDADPWSPAPPRASGAGVSADDEDSASAGHHVATERLTAKVFDPERNGHYSPSAAYRSVQ